MSWSPASAPVPLPRQFPTSARGFTLVEIAISLTILGVLLALAMVPLSEQMRAQRSRETQASLTEIREALIGFALVNGRLPCADTDGDGVENSPCTGAPGSEATLPWLSLGVASIDGWGNPWRYRVDRAFAGALLAGSNAAFTLTTPFLDNLVVRGFLNGVLAPLTVTGAGGEHPVAIVYSAGANTAPDGLNAAFDAEYQGGDAAANFDDIILWISRPVLVYRMIQAGRLP
ncbi:MAG: type II secretion system protein [Betaproteobacteria bacterium]|nr:type II secretion system protein [Betaproteobacteria bacterium]